jgi:hypothetical protein
VIASNELSGPDHHPSILFDEPYNNLLSPPVSKIASLLSNHFAGGVF